MANRLSARKVSQNSNPPFLHRITKPILKQNKKASPHVTLSSPYDFNFFFLLENERSVEMKSAKSMFAELACVGPVTRQKLLCILSTTETPEIWKSKGKLRDQLYYRSGAKTGSSVYYFGCQLVKANSQGSSVLDNILYFKSGFSERKFKVKDKEETELTFSQKKKKTQTSIFLSNGVLCY